MFITLFKLNDFAIVTTNWLLSLKVSIDLVDFGEYTKIVEN